MVPEACHGATDVPWCQRHAMVLQMGDGGTDKAMKRQMWHNAGIGMLWSGVTVTLREGETANLLRLNY